MRKSVSPPCLVWICPQTQRQQPQLRSLKPESDIRKLLSLTQAFMFLCFLGYALSSVWSSFKAWSRIKLYSFMVERTNKLELELRGFFSTVCPAWSAHAEIYSPSNTYTHTHGEERQFVIGAMWINTVQLSSIHINSSNDQRRTDMTLVPEKSDRHHYSMLLSLFQWEE